MDCILYSAFFIPSGHPKRFTILPHIHPFIHTFTHRRRRQPCKATVSSSGAVRVRRLAHGHLDIQLGGAGDRTGNLAVTSQHALPLELLPLLIVLFCKTRRFVGSFIHSFVDSYFSWCVSSHCGCVVSSGHCGLRPPCRQLQVQRDHTEAPGNVRHRG